MKESAKWAFQHSEKIHAPWRETVLKTNNFDDGDDDLPIKVCKFFGFFFFLEKKKRQGGVAKRNRGEFGMIECGFNMIAFELKWDCWVGKENMFGEEKLSKSSGRAKRERERGKGWGKGIGCMEMELNRQ